ncbi:uncharacterized protein [Clytia hemisphaerica]
MTSSVECTTKSRLLGHQENLFLSLNQLVGPLAVYANINVIESKNEILVDRVKAAFEECSKRNFLMRACVNVDSDGVALFTPINEERLMSDWAHVDEILLEEDEEWTELLPRVLEKKIDFQNGPLWYVKWLRVENNNINSTTDGRNRFTYIMIWVSSHIIIDGKSGSNLIFNQIMPLLNDKSLDQSNRIYFGKPMEKAIYNFSEDKMAVSERSVPFLFRTVTNGFVWKQSLNDGIDKVFKSSKDATLEEECRWPLQNFYQSFIVDGETNVKVVQIAKSRSVSVHSVLMVLVHHALDQARKKFNLSLGSDILLYPIDVRKFQVDLSDPQRMPLGDYHKMGQHKMLAINLNDENAFFKMAEQVKMGIQEHNQPIQEKSLFDCCFHLLQKRNLTLDTFNALPPPCVFSNLGNNDAIVRFHNNKNDVILKKHFFTLQNCSGIFVALNVYNKEMHWALSFGKSLQDGGAGQFIAETLKQNIYDFVENFA